MNYIFIPLDSIAATHIKNSDGSTGLLLEAGEVIHGNTIFVKPGEYSKIEDPPQSITHFTISKLHIRRKLREAGLESTLDALLAAHPTARVDWDDAVEISTADPMFISMLPIFAKEAKLTEAAILELLQA